MSAPRVAVIGAAGLGSRLGLGIPKCLINIEGRSIIEWQLDLLESVPDVRVVVGHRESDVVEHVSRRRPDAIFVRNPAFATTTTLHSVRLAVRHLDEPFLLIDGDLMMEPASFASFLERCVGPDPLLGITASSTDDAVFVELDDEAEPCSVRFQRAPLTGHEWSGPAYVWPRHLAASDGYVYEALEPFVPLRSHVMVAQEVDTPDDLQRARETISGWGLE